MTLEKNIQSLKRWKKKGDILEARFLFNNFSESLEATNKIGVLAEKHNHHPEITLSWGKVSIRLWSHDTKSITERDINLAKDIDLLFQ
jgi:4a-hydroxytetrahydrobiopterin dehydratase